MFGYSPAKKIYYKEDANFYKIYKQNFAVKSAIDLVARKFSNTQFKDLDNETSQLLDKIHFPNEFQSKEEFLKDFAINLLASGYSMVWKKYVSYGVFDSLELIVIPTDTDITSIGKNTVTTTINNKEETIKIEDIIFFYDTQKSKYGLTGISRIASLKSQIDNIADAQRAKNIQIHNSGTTIVSPKTSNNSNAVDEGLDKPIVQINQPLLPNGEKAPKMKTQKEEMEDRLNSRAMENRIIVSSKGVDAKNLSSELNSVNFSDKVISDILFVYFTFGIPEELTPFGKNATYNNKGEAENSLIESEIEPLNSSLCESLNIEFEGRGNIAGSYSHLSSVSKTRNEVYKTNKDIAKTYEDLFKAGLIDDKEARELLEKNGVI